jgi:hypothetical protein
MHHLAVLLLLALGASQSASAQVPLPFPRPADPRKPASEAPADPQPPSSQAPEKPLKVEPPRAPGAAASAADAPTSASLGLPVYPAAEFIASYDAGRGQRYYLFGTNATFAQIVDYYKSVLKQRGELVYDEPPIHMFEVGRFREETMAFPPGISVKDYGWAGSLGYLNPKRGAEPARFKTIIQVVPAAPAPGGQE